MDEENLGPEFLVRAAEQSQGVDAREMEGWLAGGAQAAPLSDPAGPSAQPRPASSPLRRPATGPLGTPEAEESTAGAILRNIGDIIPQAAGGVEDASRNFVELVNPLMSVIGEQQIHINESMIPGPKSGTGAVTRAAATFLTGFLPAMSGLKKLGVTGKITRPMLAGALADFAVRDPHEGRLSDMWVKAGLPKNVLTDFLASKPDDTAAEGRFKNALEGAGLGTMFEGVFLGARAIRGLRKMPEAQAAEQAVMEARYGKLTDDQFEQVLGDVDKPVITTRRSNAADKIAQGAEDTAKMGPRSLVRIRRKGADGVKEQDFDVSINFNRIDAPEQVKFAIGKMAEAMKGSIDEARRGVVTFEETTKLADDLGMSVTDLLARRKGQTFNAEEALAARNLWAASGTRLVELAKKAANPNAGPLDQFEFRKAMATHAAIQSEVIGARTETARALASWRIEAKGRTEQLRAIEQIMTGMGGPGQSQEIAKRMAMMAEAGASPAAIGRLAERGWGATSVDAIKELWINGLLANPLTHAVNTTSNALVAFQQIYERAAAMGIRQFTGGKGVEPGEATAMVYGLVESLKDAFRLSARAIATGESSLGLTKIDAARKATISPEAFRMRSDTGLGRFVDFLGGAVRVPSRLLGGEDEFFKTIGYRMELRAQALRTATQEGLRGKELATRVEEIVRNPPENIRINSADAALINTFTNQTGAFGDAVLRLRNIDHPANPLPFILPFIRTPVNIARYAFERTPFAPLVSQWRADIAAGGARADLALAKISTGTAIMTVALDMANSGMITGPGPSGSDDRDVREALTRQGIPPYSFQVGDRWYSYNRADPMGMTLGFAASIAEAVRKGEIDENDVDEWNEVTAMSIAAVAQVTVSKTYLEGFSRFIEAVSDPQRYSKQYVDDMVASFVPMTGLMNSIKNLQDPLMRDAQSPSEAVMARIAGLSEKLPPRRNLWGQPLTRESGLGKAYDFISPFASKEQVDSPVDRELVRLNSGPLRITKKAPFDGVRANMTQYPKAYDDYVRLAGNDLKHPAWGMGARDYLNSVVSGKSPMSGAYGILSDESRRDFIQNTIKEYRNLAQQAILADPQHKAFAAYINAERNEQNQSKMPVLGAQQ